MNANSISCGLLVALFAILLLYKIRKPKDRVPGTDHRGCARPVG